MKQWDDCRICPKYLCDTKKGILINGQLCDDVVLLLKEKIATVSAPCSTGKFNSLFTLSFRNGFYIEVDNDKRYYVNFDRLDEIVDFLDNRMMITQELSLEDCLSITKLRNEISKEK